MFNDYQTRDKRLNTQKELYNREFYDWLELLVLSLAVAVGVLGFIHILFS